MKEKLLALWHTFFSVQFLKFLIIGCINTFSTSVLSTVLDFLLKNYQLSFVLGYAGGLVISFFLNTIFTFKKKPTLRAAIKFPVAYIPNFLFQYLFVWIIVDLMKLPHVIAYLAAAVLALPVTFLTMKFFVFARKRRSGEDRQNRDRQ